MMWFFGDRALRPRPVWRRGVQRDGVDGVCGVFVRYGGRVCGGGLWGLAYVRGCMWWRW